MLQTVLDSMGEAVIVTDAAGVVTHLNRFAEALTGWMRVEARGEALGRVLRVDGGPGRRLDDDPFVWLRGSGTRSTPIDVGTLSARDGRKALVAGRASPLHDERGELSGLLVVLRDVTEQRLMEQQLRHSQRMARLAACTVHDFNNMLTVIGASTSGLIHRLDGQPALFDLAASALEATHRATELAREFLVVARTGGPHREAYDLHEAVRVACRLLACTIDPSVGIRLSLEAQLPTSVGDPLQLQNALLNLGLNARDAMPAGGTITVATASVMLDAQACAARGLDVPPGAYVELAVSDHGVGMDPEVARRAFEPFFTTKQAGQGTGLGLVAVHKAVTDHRGGIHVDSRPGAGTTIRLFLPVAGAHNATARAPRPRPREARGARG